MSKRNNRTERPTVTFPADLVDRIEDRLEYGDSKAEWIREACRMRLEHEASQGNKNGDGEENQ